MEYQRVVPLVHYLGEALSDMLAVTSDRPDGRQGG
jgi:hypothetical protein